MSQESKDRTAGHTPACQAQQASHRVDGVTAAPDYNDCTVRPQESAFGGVAMRLEALQRALPAGHFTLDWTMSNLGRQSSGLIILVLALLAATPGVSIPAGVLLLVVATQMVAGHPCPKLPSWIAARPLPSRSLSAILQRAIPVLKLVERIVRRRRPVLARAGEERVVGLTIVLLTIRLLTNPLPFSNVLPALLIALISLAHIEEDGLLLSIAFVISLLTLSADIVLLWKMAHQFAAVT